MYTRPWSPGVTCAADSVTDELVLFTCGDVSSTMM
jgi:hypothetical protein